MNQVWDIRKEDPLVSVCVITYNHAPYIRDCLDGVLSQKTDFPYEICIGEDESSDATREICKEYAKKYPDKIRLFLRSREDVLIINGRATGRYNFLETLKSCRGKYVARCEGDDYWIDPRKLAKQVGFLEKNPAFSLCYCNVFIRHDKGLFSLCPGYSNNPFWSRKFGVGRVPENDLDALSLVHGNMLHTPGVVMRNSLTEEHFSSSLFRCSFMADWPMNLCALQQGLGKFMNEPMAVYRVHRGGIWSGCGMEERLVNTIWSAVAMLESPFFSQATKEGLRKGAACFFRRLWFMGESYSFDSMMILYRNICARLPELEPEILREIRSVDSLEQKSFKRALVRVLKRMSGFVGQLGRKG
ncbi:glycosyltransferase family 2 protein [Pontiella sulfatireligans]|uniref:Glycosyltransferase EpsE n=1 Tax=Pontiella sulfatireligans TaxID=2750658 RepID=A0A6C2UNX0_9BACT|nr:glycosyltransferase [Pontiella sulfatireligans]VGO21027.1 Putative glycosyltransferase EpsE [Pontiella sulfatireligans]